MAENTEISWTDATFSPWIGCTKVSPGCDSCYAAVSTPSRVHGIKWGPGEPRHRTSVSNWNLPKRWNARPFVECTACGWRGEDKETVNFGDCPKCMGRVQNTRRRVFCSSLADVFDNEVDPAWRLDLFRLIHSTPSLDWLLLTKRIGNVNKMLAEALDLACKKEGGPDEIAPWLMRWTNGEAAPRNVWLGATIVNQEEADRDIPKLLAVPARVRFLSMEPLLGAVDLTNIPIGGGHGHHEFDPIITANVLHRGSIDAPHVHWVIVGGESGKEARPMNLEWVRSLRDQCAAAGVAFHLKQITDDKGKKTGMETWPADLQKRQEFPHAAR